MAIDIRLYCGAVIGVAHVVPLVERDGECRSMRSPLKELNPKLSTRNIHVLVYPAVRVVFGSNYPIRSWIDPRELRDISSGRTTAASTNFFIKA